MRLFVTWIHPNARMKAAKGQKVINPKIDTDKWMNDKGNESYDDCPAITLSMLCAAFALSNRTRRHRKTPPARFDSVHNSATFIDNFDSSSMIVVTFFAAQILARFMSILPF